MDYSIIVPVYNGELTVNSLFERIINYFNTTNFKYEVIFVYDCGPDKSWESLLKLKNKYPDIIKIIRLTRNYGQHNALICGFQYAKGDFIVTMDEDLQHDPFDIQSLIDEQKKGDYDLVYGKYIELKHSSYRNITSKIMKKLIDISIPDIHPDYSAFRLIKAPIAKATLEMQNSYTLLDGYLSWITTNTSSCPVSHNERLEGQSSYTLNKLINHSINVFVTFSDFPIRLLSKLSILVLFIMSLLGIYIVFRKLIYNDFAMGYPSMILAVGFGVGLIMLSLGIIGEYIYRINLKTTKRPNFKVREIH